MTKYTDSELEEFGFLISYLDDLRAILEKSPGICQQFESRCGAEVRSAIYNAVRAERNEIEAIDLLLDAGADINATDYLGNTTGLKAAVYKDKADVARHLLSKGADPDKGCPIRIISAKKTNPISFLEMFLDHGADLNQIDTLADGSKVTALDWYRHSNPELAEYVLSLGAKTAEQVLGLPQIAVPPEDIVEKALVAYFTKKFGPVANGSIQEIVPDVVDTKIRWVPPGGRVGIFRKRNETYVLFTVGMSRRPQQVPFGEQDYRFAELSIELPPTWPSPEIAIKNPQTAWPIQWLRRLAAYPTAEKSWLGGPVTIIANEDALKPLGPGCPFSAWMLICHTEKSEMIKCKDGTQIARYICFPIYKEEYQFERRHGVAALTDLFIKNGLPEIVFIDRPNFAKLKSN